MPVNTTATVFDIVRSSLHDGRGIRTVVYLKGCSLRCQWCHNPEGIAHEQEIFVNAQRCIGCNRCGRDTDASRAALLRNADKCPSGAIKVIGRQMSAHEVFEQIKKDTHYFARTGGGVTFSGGECLLFPDFMVEVLSLCRQAGIHTIVESALNIRWNSINEVIPFVNAFLIDLKVYDSAKHALYTGCGNESILENIRQLAKIHHDITVRIPLIPGVNDDEDNIALSAKFCFSLGINKIELLKYNNLAQSKYDMLGMEAIMFAEQTQSAEKVEYLYSLIESCRLKNSRFI